MIFWNLHEHCNYLQITQIGNYLQKLFKHHLAWLWLKADDLKAIKK